MLPITGLIKQFAEAVVGGKLEVYNEFSLQNELGIFLREKCPYFKVQFERNVTFFFLSKGLFTKREIDISLFPGETRELTFAIELKFPRNGQYPEQMFSFCKDISCLEELIRAGSSAAALLIFADDPVFYRGSGQGIYGLFS